MRAKTPKNRFSLNLLSLRNAYISRRTWRAFTKSFKLSSKNVRFRGFRRHRDDTQKAIFRKQLKVQEDFGFVIATKWRIKESLKWGCHKIRIRVWRFTATESTSHAPATLMFNTSAHRKGQLRRIFNVKNDESWEITITNQQINIPSYARLTSSDIPKFQMFLDSYGNFHAFDVFEFQILPTAADLDWK